MPTIQTSQIAMILAGGPLSSKSLEARLNVNQSTLTVALKGMDEELVHFRQGQTTLYAIRDAGRGFADVPIHRVDTEGGIQRIGTLTPVRDDGYIMEYANVDTQHSQGLPWWLQDMCPQGFMGRAYASSLAINMALPEHLVDWSDTHSIRVLLKHGHDVTGNLVLGELAHERLLNEALGNPIALQQRASTYSKLSSAAIRGDAFVSQVGGEQPKFTAYVETQEGARHVIVKFSLDADCEVTQRWRDLLLCEHHALETLRNAGVQASKTSIFDSGSQRFLEVERFDRIGRHGRRGLVSLSALDSEFAGMANRAWPDITKALLAAGRVTPDAHESATLLYAYGCLIANTDMHHGNLSFLENEGGLYLLAPAYDMLPMAFRPRMDGSVINTVNAVALHPAISPQIWQRALGIARRFLDQLKSEIRLSKAFLPCLQSLEAHVDTIQVKINALV